MEWRDLAKECRRAAAMARESGSFRAAVNRCYYALFSDIAHGALVSGWNMPMGWEGPHHDQVHEGGIVSAQFGRWLRPEEQGRLIALASELYKYRRIADYCPSVFMGEDDAKVAFGKLLVALQISEKVA